MNLLIVERKSKTQMRNMFYWAGIISILICLPLRVSAQSYEQMWKQVEVLENQSKVEPVLTNLIVRQVLPRQQLSVYPDLPLVRGLQKIQAPQQRGFSASRGADDG